MAFHDSVGSAIQLSLLCSCHSAGRWLRVPSNISIRCPARGVSPSSFLPKQSGTTSGHCGHVQAPVSLLSRICCSSVRLIGVKILPVVEIKRIHSGVVTPAWGVGKVPGTRTHYPNAPCGVLGNPHSSGPHRTLTAPRTPNSGNVQASCQCKSVASENLTITNARPRMSPEKGL